MTAPVILTRITDDAGRHAVQADVQSGTTGPSRVLGIAAAPGMPEVSGRDRLQIGLSAQLPDYRSTDTCVQSSASYTLMSGGPMRQSDRIVFAASRCSLCAWRFMASASRYTSNTV